MLWCCGVHGHFLVSLEKHEHNVASVCNDMVGLYLRHKGALWFFNITRSFWYFILHLDLMFDVVHSGAERSPGQKKHIIGGSYIVWNVCAVRFGNSWRKNMALGSFGEKCKKAIFVHFWLPFLVLALSCNFFFAIFGHKSTDKRRKY